MSEPPRKRARTSVVPSGRMFNGPPPAPAAPSFGSVRSSYSAPDAPGASTAFPGFFARRSSRARTTFGASETVTASVLTHVDPTRHLHSLLFTHVSDGQWASQDTAKAIVARVPGITTIGVETIVRTLNAPAPAESYDAVLDRTDVPKLLCDLVRKCKTPREFVSRFMVLGTYHSMASRESHGLHGARYPGTKHVIERRVHKTRVALTAAVAGLATVNDFVGTEMLPGTRVYLIIHYDDGKLRATPFAHYKYEHPSQHENYYTKWWPKKDNFKDFVATKPVCLYIGRVAFTPSHPAHCKDRATPEGPLPEGPTVQMYLSPVCV